MALTLIVLCAMIHVSFGGKAFPVKAENYATLTFNRLNRNLEYDPTNFLVDLSGFFAKCENIDKSGRIELQRKTTDQQSIGGLVDSIPAYGKDSYSIQMAIITMVHKWMRTSRSGDFKRQILAGRRFGCSVEPGCNGRASVACLFSPGLNCSVLSDQRPKPSNPAKQTSLAFTGSQYLLAEKITGKTWDRSHYLENLSGFDTECGMIGKRSWAFTTAYREAKRKGMAVTGLFGHTPNTGSTQVGISTVLRRWKVVGKSNQIGCSVIPDCRYGRRMVVVVGCLFGMKK